MIGVGGEGGGEDEEERTKERRKVRAGCEEDTSNGARGGKTTFPGAFTALDDHVTGFEIVAFFTR